mmetsp:Transcript_10851/g.31570  ORF Transcript_10851/g.31570 Transcript_10851/m.31570 type:complete len:348 (+) Transcript_10851:190-1233(+)
MVSFSHCAILFAVVAVVFAKFLVRNVGDGSAQTIAKVRHVETMYGKSERLYSDPYARYMYMGSFVMEWMGVSKSQRLFDIFFPGLLELLTLRTKWIDDQIAIHAARGDNDSNGDDDDDDGSHCGQLVILGAGYDTRGFRLNTFSEGFKIIEVDQPSVQASKRRVLQEIAEHNRQVASRLKDGTVTFVPMDFNNHGDSFGETLRIFLDSDQCAIVVLEGVTQYIPKASTASTLKQLNNLLPKGSILLVSYVPQVLFDDPGQIAPPDSIRFLLKGAKWAGEPWISAWNKAGFSEFLSSELCGGYEILSDSAVTELEEQYLFPLRKNRGGSQRPIPPLERYVVARVVTKQ